MRAAALVIAGLTFACAACVSLVGTTSPPDSADAAADATGTPTDAGADVNLSPDVDAAVAVDYSTACTGQVDGKYCNGNRIVVDGGSKDDLVSCLNQQTLSAKLCTNGCQWMPFGFPDECDQCQGKASGLYCGDDFAEWAPENADIRIRCENDAIVGNLICSSRCVGSGPTAACQ